MINPLPTSYFMGLRMLLLLRAIISCFATWMLSCFYIFWHYHTKLHPLTYSCSNIRVISVEKLWETDMQILASLIV